MSFLCLQLTQAHHNDDFMFTDFSFNDPTKVCTTQQTSSVKEGQNQSNVYENTHIQPGKQTPL